MADELILKHVRLYYIGSNMYYIILAVALVAADQILKYLAIRFVNMGGQIPIIEGFFNITCIKNEGIAMGMFSGMQTAVIALTSVVMLMIALYILKEHKKRNRLELTLLVMILAGGIGNLIDRIRLNYVVDYIDFQIWNYIFNFADICVVLGCLGMFFCVFFDSKGK